MNPVTLEKNQRRLHLLTQKLSKNGDVKRKKQKVRNSITVNNNGSKSEEKKRSKYSYRCSNCGKGTQTNIPNCWIKHMKIADNDSMCRYCFSSKYGFYNGGNPKISKDEFNSSEKKPFYIVNSTEAKTYLRPIWKQLDRLGEEHILYTGSHTGMYFLVQYGEELKFCCDT